MHRRGEDALRRNSRVWTGVAALLWVLAIAYCGLALYGTFLLGTETADEAAELFPGSARRATRTVIEVGALAVASAVGAVVARSKGKRAATTK